MEFMENSLSLGYWALSYVRVPRRWTMSDDDDHPTVNFPFDTSRLDNPKLSVALLTLGFHHYPRKFLMDSTFLRQ
jgi:hypothetical protein